jgi:hypothetical protein
MSQVSLRLEREDMLYSFMNNITEAIREMFGLLDETKSNGSRGGP